MLVVYMKWTDLSFALANKNKISHKQNHSWEDFYKEKIALSEEIQRRANALANYLEC